MESIDGFYAAFLTGREGSGFIVLLIRQRAIVGADILGTTYDGTVELGSKGSYHIRITVRSPPNIPIMQGGYSGPTGDVSEIEFALPPTFLEEPFIRIETNTGPVNCKFSRIRDLND